MKIGKRSINGLLQRLLDVNSYKSISNFLQLYDNPWQSMAAELLSLGDYPREVRINTPAGTHDVSLFSVADFSTLNLVFCRKDYFTPVDTKTVVDIGSNIGISAMYWLTRNTESVVYCYEPSPTSFERLRKNTSPFKERCFLFRDAVSDFSGKATLGVEKSGVYSSIDYAKYTEKTFIDHVECNVLNINDVLEKILTKNSVIDVLKIDSEGHELRTVMAINRSFWPFIRCLNIEKCGAAGYVPSDFTHDIVASAERFYR
jgi:FkbM family methyltransferase